MATDLSRPKRRIGERPSPIVIATVMGGAAINIPYIPPVTESSVLWSDRWIDRQNALEDVFRAA